MNCNIPFYAGSRFERTKSIAQRTNAHGTLYLALSEAGGYGIRPYGRQ